MCGRPTVSQSPLITAITVQAGTTDNRQPVYDQRLWLETKRWFSFGATMADEPEPPEDELGEVESVEPTDPEYYDTDAGYLIFPHGSQWYAETYDFSALRITSKTGEVEGQDVVSGKWRKASQGKSSAGVVSIKSDKQS